jgi:hypothetical protein
MGTRYVVAGVVDGFRPGPAEGAGDPEVVGGLTVPAGGAVSGGAVSGGAVSGVDARDAGAASGMAFGDSLVFVSPIDMNVKAAAVTPIDRRTRVGPVCIGVSSWLDPRGGIGGGHGAKVLYQAAFSSVSRLWNPGEAAMKSRHVSGRLHRVDARGASPRQSESGRS